MDFKRIALATVIGTATALAGCSGGGSSSSSDKDPITPSGFTFTVNDNYTGSGDQTVAQNLLSYLVSPAFAAVGAQNIQVVSVDAEGKITAVLTPKEGPTDLGNGQFRVVLNEGDAVNHVIVVNPEAPLNLQPGQTLNPAAYLYMPAVDEEEEFEINLASTAAYHLFLQAADSFENISAEEVDRIMDAVAEKIEGLDLTAADRTAMLTALFAELKTLVETETKLAQQTVEGATLGSTGTIEGDRAKIKGFFDDVNTIAVLSEGLTDDTNKGLAEELYEQVNAGQQIWQASAASMEDFAEIQSVLTDALNASRSGVTQDIATLFANYPESNLSGSIAETETGISVNVSGSYGVLTTVALSATANASTTTEALRLSMNGTLESAEALIVLNNAAAIVTTTSGISISPDDERYGEELDEKLDKVEMAVGVSLTAKDLLLKDGETHDGTFSGTASMTVVRTNQAWVEFAGDDAQSFENVESFSLSGRFELGSEFVEATVNAEQPNARTFIPLTQEYLAGETYTDLFSYSYNGVDTFTYHAPDGDREYKAYTHDYEVLTFYTEQESEDVYWDTNPSFSGYVASRVFNINHTDGYYSFRGQDLTEGSGVVEAVKGDIDSGSSDTVAVSYSLNGSSLNFFIDQYSYQKTFTFNRIEDQIAYIDVIHLNGEKAYKWYGGYAKTLEEYMEDRTEFFYISEYDAYYLLNYSDLIKGTVDGTALASLNWYWGAGNPPATVEIAYDYTDEGFILNKGAGQNEERSKKVLGVNRYQGLAVDVSRSFVPYLFDRAIDQYEYTNWADSYDTFEAFIDSYYFSHNHWDYVQNLGEFELDFADTLVTGQNVPVSAYAWWTYSLEDAEHDSHFRNYKISATINTRLTGLGVAQVSAEFERTGFADAIASFTLSNQFADTETNLNSEITVHAAAVNAEISSFVVSNNQGLSIASQNIQENEDGFEITFGLETAVVQEVDTGLKVTFSDGTFYLY